VIPQALRWIVAGALLAAGSVMPAAAQPQPLTDLQARLAGLPRELPSRVKVDVELRHKGSAPLHRNDKKMRGEAVLVNGRFGPEVRRQKWTQTGSRFSFWKADEDQAEIDLVTEGEAEDLMDPVGVMADLLDGAELVGDEAVTWRDRPARLVTFRLSRPELKEAESQGASPPPIEENAKVWLDETGLPLALERSASVRLGGVAKAAERRTLTFRSVDGRLLVDEVEAEYSNEALVVLRGRDFKKMKVTSVE
jgi:hypothetical protein